MIRNNINDMLLVNNSLLDDIVFIDVISYLKASFFTNFTNSSVKICFALSEIELMIEFCTSFFFPRGKDHALVDLSWTNNMLWRSSERIAQPQTVKRCFLSLKFLMASLMLGINLFRGVQDHIAIQKESKLLRHFKSLFLARSSVQ